MLLEGCLKISKTVEMDEMSFVWLQWQPANEQILLAHVGLKTISF